MRFEQVAPLMKFHQCKRRIYAGRIRVSRRNAGFSSFIQLATQREGPEVGRPADRQDALPTLSPKISTRLEQVRHLYG